MVAQRSVDVSNVELPLASHEVARPKVRSSPSTEFSILVIDDDLEGKRVLRMALKWTRFPVDVSVRLADDCETALTGLVDGSAPLPSLILMNLERKGSRCLKALQSLRSHDRTCAIPVIGWTRASEGFDEAYAEHVNCVLLRPTSVEAAEQTLLRLVSFWTLPNIILPARN